MPTTTRLGLPYPVLAGSANVPADIQALATALDGAGLYSQGLFSARPAAAGITGRFYWSTDTSKLYLSNGAAWIDLGPNTIGADSITAAMIQANAITASELADDSVDTPAIQALAVTNAKLAASAVDGSKVAASLKPSGGAGGATEALRALGTTAGTALAGDAAVATPVTAVVSIGAKAVGSTYTITAPAAGTYILEWGAPAGIGAGQGSSGNITNNVTAGAAVFADVGTSGGTALRTGVVLTAGQVITFTVNGNNNGVTDPWAKLTRTA